MTVHRTYKAGFLNEVANHPKVRPWLGGDGASLIDMAPLIVKGAVALVNNYGGFIFAPTAPGVYEVHTQFLPGRRGVRAAAREAVTYMFERVGAEKITTDVPENNQAALGLALDTGFEMASSRQDDGSFSGKAQRILELDLSRAAFAKARRQWSAGKMVLQGGAPCQ